MPRVRICQCPERQIQINSRIYIIINETFYKQVIIYNRMNEGNSKRYLSVFFMMFLRVVLIQSPLCPKLS